MVKPKKYLGQHFLTDKNIARKIVECLSGDNSFDAVLEVGPGKGILTGFLLEKYNKSFHAVEIDEESIEYLCEKIPSISGKIAKEDILETDLERYGQRLAIIGNFPYNISSQIFFKILDYRYKVTQVVCMLQQEVAKRIVSPPGNKDYGILSVLLQAFYKIEYKFKVKPGSFYPQPKINSGVIKLLRNENLTLKCDEDIFFKVVKQGFQNRRKTLRNALKPLNLPENIRALNILNQRAEQLSVDDFINLSLNIQSVWKR